MANNTPPILISLLAAYAEDPRGYCHYKGVPRSIHNRNNQQKITRKNNPLSSSLSRNLLFLIILCLILSGAGFFWAMPVDIIGFAINSGIILYATTGLFFLAIALWLARSFFIRRALFKLCGVPTSSYRLLGSNLTWLKRSIKLTKDNLFGTPSTLFLKKNGETAFVCQYNSRNFNGNPKVRERYQILLFMGIIKEQYKLENIKGAIRYNDHLEFIKYESVVYKNLLALQDEYNEAIQEWEAPDIQPLFKRDKTF